MTERRRWTLKDRLEILVRQAYCPKCGGKLGELKGLEWHHQHELALGGADEPENVVALHKDCHAIVTNGPGATSAGSSKHKIAKARRLSADPPGGEAFRRKLLAPTAYLAADHQDRGAKRQWPKRPFPKRRKP